MTVRWYLTAKDTRVAHVHSACVNNPRQLHSARREEVKKFFNSVIFLLFEKTNILLTFNIQIITFTLHFPYTLHYHVHPVVFSSQAHQNLPQFNLAPHNYSCVSIFTMSFLSFIWTYIIIVFLRHRNLFNHSRSRIDERDAFAQLFFLNFNLLRVHLSLHLTILIFGSQRRQNICAIQVHNLDSVSTR